MLDWKVAPMRMKTYTKFFKRNKMSLQRVN
jgi:hypothetical protein